MGLPIKKYYKTDPPKTLYEFSENNVVSDFFYKICLKCPKNSPKKDQNKKMHFFLSLSYWLNY